MSKLAPAPAPPIDLVPTETRRESTLIPNSAPVPERGPTINRDKERSSLLANLNQGHITASTSVNQPVTPPVTEAARSPRSQSSSSPPAQSPGEAITQTDERLTISGKATSQPKHTPLQSAEAITALKEGEQKEERQGLFGPFLKQLSVLSHALSISDLAASAKEMMHGTAQKLGAWTRLNPKATPRESLNIKPPPQSSLSEEWRRPAETMVVAPCEDEPHRALDSARRHSLTDQALTTVAAATQSQTEEKEKKQADAAEKGRAKENAQASLRKLQLEGLSPGELAEISAELTGVYGTAEVALRHAQDLLARKKPS